MPTKSPPGKKPPIKTPAQKTSNAAADLVAHAVEGMEKKFGKGAAITPKSDTVLCRVETWASCRNFLIDQAIAGGNPAIPGGIPFGRLTEIAGRNGSGKTTLLGHIVASTQKMGGIACISDTEQALDLGYWSKLGVNLDHLVLSQSECIEEVFEKATFLIHTIKDRQANVPVLIGWDSLGGTPTKAQLEADTDQNFYAEAAKVVGKNMQKITNLIAKERIALVFINHLYRDINVKYGDPWQSYGGEKVQFCASLRIRLVRGAPIKEGGSSQKEDDDDKEDKDTIGNFNRVQILKNKMAPVLRTVKVPCLGNHGFCEDYSIYEMGQRLKIIEKNKAWSKVEVDGDEINFQGWSGFQEKVMTHLRYSELVQLVRKMYSQSKVFEG
jgi:recombination protein RecA